MKCMHTLAALALATLTACGAAPQRTSILPENPCSGDCLLKMVDRDATEAASKTSGLISIGLLPSKGTVVFENWLPRKNCVEAPGCDVHVITNQDGTFAWPTGLQHGTIEVTNLIIKGNLQQLTVTIVGNVDTKPFEISKAVAREEQVLLVLDINKGTLVSRLEYDQAHPQSKINIREF